MKFSTVVLLLQVVALILFFQGLFVAFFYWRSNTIKNIATSLESEIPEISGELDVYSAPLLYTVVKEFIHKPLEKEAKTIVEQQIKHKDDRGSASQGCDLTAPGALTLPVPSALGDVLAWNPDDTSLPGYDAAAEAVLSSLKSVTDKKTTKQAFSSSTTTEPFDIGSYYRHHLNKVPRFDFLCEQQRSVAMRYRDAGLPFVMRNIPELDAASVRWSSAYLGRQFGEHLPRTVEKSRSRHFMYYSLSGRKEQLLVGGLGTALAAIWKSGDGTGAESGAGAAGTEEVWTPPQEEIKMTYAEFVREIERAEAKDSRLQGRPQRRMETQKLRERIAEATQRHKFYAAGLKNPSSGHRQLTPSSTSNTNASRGGGTTRQSVSVDTNGSGDGGGGDFYYMTIASQEGARMKWIAEAFPFFSNAPHPLEEHVAAQGGGWGSSFSNISNSRTTAVRTEETLRYANSPAAYEVLTHMERERNGASSAYANAGDSSNSNSDGSGSGMRRIKYKGINCRIAMRGVTAAAHFDGHDNYIGLVRGVRRYVLLPPDQCDGMRLLPRSHPSARHSAVNWSNSSEFDEKFRNSRALEVLLTAGDMLFLPAHWLHFIVSLTPTVQCNGRFAMTHPVALLDPCVRDAFGAYSDVRRCHLNARGKRTGPAKSSQHEYQEQQQLHNGKAYERGRLQRPREAPFADHPAVLENAFTLNI